MNITLRKLAMLEKKISEQEEQARVEGYITSSIDTNLKNKIYLIMDKIRMV